jgi:methionine-rich copper-binding protein CopC
MRLATLFGMIPLLLTLASGEAASHASLDRAEPRVGNTVTTAPREVRLWFTQKLETAFSTMSVTDEAGQRVDAGKARVNGDTMVISLRQIGSGTYRVSWRVLSVDTHTTDGNFTFKVGP